MKILVTWYSGTGNTEKIAKAINEGITGHDVDLLPVNDVDPTSLNSYDLVFLGFQR
ncbi:MAG: flavodoxin family protein [Promethearchaeota archaeon]